MTQTLAASRPLRGVTIRAYRPADHSACRRLWAELSQHRQALHGEPARAGTDAGAGFEEYLTQLTLSGMWVADHGEAGVVGFIGLTLQGRSGAVNPVVVTASLRGQGIGQALLARVAEEAQRRGLARLVVSPPVRDVAALRAFHGAGFRTIATVTLSYDLPGGGPAATVPTSSSGLATRETTEDTVSLFTLPFAA